jgi:cbb3-type cytochrome oxidase subunit 3
MSLIELSELARTWWSAWLMLLFVSIVVWALWPSAGRKEEMRRNAMIPFRDEDDHGPETETR